VQKDTELSRKQSDAHSAGRCRAETMGRPLVSDRGNFDRLQCIDSEE
jgi:hypothetical protein